MAADATDPDTYEDDFEDDEEAVGLKDVEAPVADTAEQQAELLQHRDEPMTGRDLSEANPADRAEQARVVDLDEEDEYR